MRCSTLFFLSSLAVGTSLAQTGGLLDRIGSREKAVSAVSQSLTGTWMLELRPPGVPVAVPAMVTYLAEGTAIGPTSDGNSSPSHGVWIRVGDRKFLQTMYIFLYDDRRALTGIQKVRIGVQLGEDGRTVKGVVDRVLLDREGNETASFTGGSFTGVRLTAEKFATYEEFLKEDSSAGRD